MSGECENFKCPTLSNIAVIEVVLSGVPFLISSIVSCVLLSRVSFKHSRLDNLAVDCRCCGEGRDPFAFEKWKSSIVFGIRFATLILPVLLLLGWIAMTVWLLWPFYNGAYLPLVIGYSVFVLGYVYLFGSYGLLHWRAERYRLNVVSLFCFCTSAALVIILQVVYSIEVLTTYRSSYVVFVGTYNIAVVMAPAYLNRVIHKPLDFRMFLTLKADDRKLVEEMQSHQLNTRFSMLLCYLFSVAILVAFAIAMIAAPNVDDALGFQVLAALIFSDLAVVFLHSAGLAQRPTVLYIMTAISRISMFVADKEYWFIGVCFNYGLYGGLLVTHIVDRYNPIVSSEEAVERAVGGLESVLNKPALGGAAAGAAAHAPGPAGTGSPAIPFSEEKRVENEKHKKDAREIILGFFENNRLPVLKTPEFSLCLISLVFGGLTIFAAIADHDSLSCCVHVFPRLHVLETDHPQYEFGVIVLIFVIAFAFAFLAWRRFSINNFDLTGDRAVPASIFLFLIISIGSIVGLSYSADSDLLRIYGFYVPCVLTLAAFTYTRWVKMDYHWNRWPLRQMKIYEKKLREASEAKAKARLELIESGGDAPIARSNSLASEAGVGTKFVGEAKDHFAALKGERTDKGYLWVFPALATFFTGQHERDDYVLASCVALMVVLIIAMGVSLAPFFTPWISFLIPEIIGVIIMTLFFLLEWTATLQFGVLLSLGIAGVLVHICFALADHVSDGAVSFIFIFAVVFVFPAVLGFVMAVYSWKVQNWKITPLQRNAFAACAVLLLAFLVTVTAYSENYVFGIVSIVTFILGTFFFSMAVLWSSNDFHLEPIWTKISIGLASSLMILTLLLQALSHVYWFWCFTTVWTFLFVGLAANAIQRLHETDTSRLLSSVYVFPVYRWSPLEFGASNNSDQTIREDSKGLVCLYLATLMCMIWGLLAAVLVHPEYVGWIVFAVGALSFVSTTMDRLYTPAHDFWTAFGVSCQSPGMIEHARQQAIKNEIRAGQQRHGVVATLEVVIPPTSVAGGGGGAAGASGAAEPVPSPSRPAKAGVALAVSDVHFSVAADSKSGDDADGAEKQQAAKNYLSATQMYWDWEQRSQIGSLIEQRDVYSRSVATPADGDAIEYAERRRAKLEEIDEFIRFAFEEQSRMVVSFMLLLIIGADVYRQKKKKVYRDFVRRYIRDKQNEHAKQTRASIAAGAQPPPPTPGSAPEMGVMDFTRMKHWEITAWAEANKDALMQKKIQYISDDQKQKADDEKVARDAQNAAEARRKLQRQREIDLSLEQQRRESHPPAQPAAGGAAGGVGISIVTANGERKSNLPVIATVDSKIEVDAYRYQKRTLPPELVRAVLDTRGATIDDVAAKAQQTKQIIEMSTAHVTAAAGVGGAVAVAAPRIGTTFIDGTFPPPADLVQTIEGGSKTPDAGDLKAGLFQSLAANGGGAVVPRICWRRPPEFLKSPQVFVDGASPRDIIQGELEDCYLLSAISVLAKDPAQKRVEKLFVVDVYNEVGLYGMHFFVDGEWRTVFVDDQFPTKDGKWVFARSQTPNELWVAILEKCYAKLYNGYDAIVGGLVHDSLQDLTGGAAEEIKLSGGDDSIDGDVAHGAGLRVWSKIYLYHTQGYLMGCGNPMGKGRQFAENTLGIVQGHAYAILDLKELTGETAAAGPGGGDGILRLLKLRNPWGNTEWSGAWSDRDKRWDNNKYRSLLAHQPNEADGVFWMSWDDFQLQFKRIYICRLFENVRDLDEKGAEIKSPAGTAAGGIVPNTPMPSARDSALAAQRASVDMKKTGQTATVVTIPMTPRTAAAATNNNAAAATPAPSTAVGAVPQKWYRRRVKNEWKGITAGGVSITVPGSHPECNPQYALQLNQTSKPGFVFITLTQPSSVRKEYKLVCLLVLSKDGLRCQKVKKRDVAGGELTFVAKREISVEVRLEPNKAYTIFACTHEPGVESPFTITHSCAMIYMITSSLYTSFLKSSGSNKPGFQNGPKKQPKANSGGSMEDGRSG